MLSQDDDRKKSAGENAPAYQEPRLFHLGAALAVIQGGQDGDNDDSNMQGWYSVASPQSRPKPE